MKEIRKEDIKNFLDQKAEKYNSPEFIEKDPISIPHTFKKKQDIEISGLFASILAWGKRSIIINKCKELIQRMDGSPYNFILTHDEHDLKSLTGFKHRTFNDTDLLYFVEFLKNHYTKYESLEDAFITPFSKEHNPTIKNIYLFGTGINLITFRNNFFSLATAPERTRKHISHPISKSACKRLNMFLRWMVRKDNKGVDFGIWKNIPAANLICPIDVHVHRVAGKLGLIESSKADWDCAVTLTRNLRNIDKNDPAKYDFALFGLGVEGYC